jgi:type I restriction enzyme S subunit
MKTKKTASVPIESLPDGEELSEGWKCIILEDYVYIAARIGWRGLKREEYTKIGPLFLAVKDIQENGAIDYQNVTDHLSEFRYDESPEIQLKNQDIIITKDGTIGKIGFVENLPGKVTVNSSLLVVRPSPEILPRFLFFYFRSRNFQSIVHDRITGSAVPHLFQKDIKKFQILVPPLDEQQRIVTRVEALLSHVNATRYRLSRVPLIMKKFRQAVLVAACSGGLTEEWREENKNEIQIPSLTDLLLNRKELWKSRNGKSSSCLANKTKQKYKEPKESSENFIEDLPSSWIPITVTQLAFLDVGFSFSSKDFQNSGIRLLRGENIEPGSLRWKDTKYWSEEQLNGYQHLLLENGEIVLGMDRPLISTGFKIARVKPDDLPCLLVQRVTRFKMVDPDYTDLLFYNLQNEKFQKYLAEKGLTGSALPHITGSAVADYTVGLPCKEESNEIVRRVGLLFERADAFDQEVAAAGRRCERLTQAVLGKAFAGKL